VKLSAWRNEIRIPTACKAGKGLPMFDNGGKNKTRLDGCQCEAASLDFNHEQGGDHV
jgi:hypothetical protein